MDPEEQEKNLMRILFPILILIMLTLANCSSPLLQNNFRNNRGPASSDRPLDEMSAEEIEEMIRRDLDIGPVVPVNKSEQLQNYLQEIFKKLSQAHSEIANADRFIVNRFSIVDTTIPNAFVLHIERPGVSASENVVMITTELLRRMMEESPGVPLPQEKWGLFEKRIVGIFAHELAHPLDDYDKDGMKKNQGKRIASPDLRYLII